MAGAFDDFKNIRERVDTEWAQTAPGGNPISKGLADKIEKNLLARGHS